jgi:hypothetical protein
MMPKRTPGPKSRLPPRGPLVQRWPRISTNFEIERTVTTPLADAGCCSFCGFSADIVPIIECYISHHAVESTSDHQARLTCLRKDAAKLCRDLSRFINQRTDDDGRDRIANLLSLLPVEEDVVGGFTIAALNEELDSIDELEVAPDFEFVRDRLVEALRDAAGSGDEAPADRVGSTIDDQLICGLTILRHAAERVRNAESGGGAPADRNALVLVRGLAVIFQERSKRNPSPSPAGHFAAFVRAVDELIPEEFRLDDGESSRLDHLIATAAHQIARAANTTA